MLSPRTLRGQLSFMITIIGGIGLLSSIFIVNIFVDQILEDQRISSLELVKQESITEIKIHKNLMTELGLRIQKKPNFRKAIKNKDTVNVQSLLNAEFFQYYITARVLIVNKIYAFDKKFNQISQSTEGNDYGSETPLCDQLPNKAILRKGAERLKAYSSFCSYEKHAFHSVVVPIGTLSPIGYIQIISEPQNIFKDMEKKLGMPLRITSATNEISYQSDKWDTHKNDNLLKLHLPLLDINNVVVANIEMQKDITQTKNTYSRTRTLIIILISFITLIGVFVFLYIFERSMLKPLNLLAKEFTILKQNKNNFGNQLKLQGSPEIVSLTENFNGLTKRLSTLYVKLEDMAFTDQLTSLPNRSRLHEILEFHTSLNHRDNTPFCLFMMDLDQFKMVNDTLGHHVGDILLQHVSERLKSILRKSDYISMVSETDSHLYKTDIVARLGGDEFAAVLPAMSCETEAKIIAEKILNVMEEPFVIDSLSLNVGVSIGIALCPIHGSNSEILMQHADAAMYEAKNRKIGFTVFNPNHDSQIKKNRSLDTDLRKAVSNNELNLVYQPKIDLRSQQIVGVETLLRWIHKDDGFISPEVFISIAEESGLINEVTNWVIKNSLEQKSQWEKQGIHLSLAINLSPKNLLDKNLVSNIANQLELRAISPETIYLELTETAIMSDPSHAIIVLRQLYDMGIRISIDDFGTGYSSLSYLKKLPIDEIKIDRSFVMDMEDDGNDAIIVQSTIDLAHNMGLRVIAEGVENQSILDDLGKRSCDLAQGFYMAKPMNNEDLLKWIKTSDWGFGGK